MLQYMFTPEGELPAGVGFTHFGAAHLAALAALCALSTLVVLVGCHMPERRRRRLLRAMAAAMIAMEVWKDLTLVRIGSFSVGYLPLHLCSIAMFICLWFAWRPDSDTAGQLVWSLCFSGGVAALLFPDWTNMPLWHFQSLHSFVYHAMLVQFALIAVISGQARPRVGRVWKAGLFLAGAAVPVYWLNRLLGTNYMFLNRPLAGTPLMLCARLPGRWGYLLGYGLLAAVILVLLDLPFSLWAHRRQLADGAETDVENFG